MTRDFRRFEAHPFRDFLFPPTVGRIAYLVRSFLIGFLGETVLPPLVRQLHDGPFNPVVLCAGLLAFAACVALMVWAALLPRLRDLQWSPKWVWLGLVPVVSQAFFLLLLFTPGRSSRR